MHLVDDKHLNADRPQQAHRGLFEVDDGGARAVRRSQRGEDLSVKPALAWAAGHLDHKQPGSRRP